MRMFRFWSPRQTCPKVFGFGLSRTGTTSLNRALRKLGYRVHSFDPRLLEAWHQGNVTALFDVTDRFDGFEDWPFPLAFREIAQRYGTAARYVLTVRSTPQIWLESYLAHFEKGTTTARHAEMTYGFAEPRGHEAEHLAFYERHNAAVRQVITEYGLAACFAELCWERGDGWTELCALTGLHVPQQPFPHKNRRPSSRISV